MTQRAVFTNAYAFIPKGCFSDIVTSFLPGWNQTKLRLIARPMSGIAETFSQYVMERRTLAVLHGRPGNPDHRRHGV